MNCPLPDPAPSVITMAHGGGGRLSQQLIDTIFAPAFGMTSSQLHDGAELGSGDFVVATDAHVVKPLFFPGGDIGALAAHGSCNDLAMCAAKPLWLAVSFILEEGLSIQTLDTIAQSLAHAAALSGAKVVTGDTKVIESSRGDGLYLSVAAFGKRQTASPVSASDVQEGDVLVINGDVGRHGCAVLSAREGLGFASDIPSDCAPLWPQVEALLQAEIVPRWMRDCTRGGLATVLAELADAASREIIIEESSVPVCEAVRGACELFGLDPLYVANEGRFVACFAPSDVNRAVAILRGFSNSCEASPIAHVGALGRGRVIARQAYGSSRVLDRLAGEQLPRIC